MKTGVGHYRGKIFAWDVVNEAFDELQPGELRSTIWRDQPGIGLVAKTAPPISNAVSAGRTRPIPRHCCFITMQRRRLLILSRTRSRPWFAISAGAASRLMAWDCRCPLRTGTPMPPRFLKTSSGSRRSACRCTSPRWTSRCRSMRRATLDERTCGGRRISIVKLLPLAWLTHGMHGHPDLGSHRQIFLDGIALPEDEGAALLFDRNYRAKPAYAAVRNELESPPR